MRRINRGWFFALSLLFAIPAMAQDEEEEAAGVNFGFKAGFAATIYQISSLEVNGVDVTDDIEETSRVGYFGTIFTRINIGRHFIQPEVTFLTSKYTISFDKSSITGAANDAGVLQYSMTNYTIDVPILYGYNFVKSGPYMMSLFLGPKLRFPLTGISKQKFVNFDDTGIREHIKHVQVAAEIGLSVTISRVFFDFTYDFGLQNMSHYFESDNPGYSIKFDRHKNMMAFSLGFML